VRARAARYESKRRRMVDPQSDNPLRGEAQAQDEQTIMPWLWGGVGLLVIAAFVVWMLLSQGHRIREPAGAAPITKSISQLVSSPTEA
jgi:hypothetical protein